MGEVYRVRELATGRILALKLVTGHLEPARQERFRREGELTARLDHPGIVRVIGSGALGGRPYLTYELIEGAQGLDAAASKLSPKDGLALLRDAALALGAAHAAGVVHRDVKPENLLVDAGGRVRVADFGLALAGDSERLTKTGGFVGTPSYLAPEQISGGELGPAVDVWALGVVLFELTAGELPFTGTSLIELMAAICRESPPALADAGLDRIARAALAKEPSARPADGAAFAALLEAYLQGEQAPRARDPRRWLLAGLLVLVALIGAVLVRLKSLEDVAAPGASDSPRANASRLNGTPRPSASEVRPASSPALLRIESKESLADAEAVELYRARLSAWTPAGLDLSGHDHEGASLLAPFTYRGGAFSLRCTWRIFRQGGDSSLSLTLFRTDVPSPLVRLRVVTRAQEGRLLRLNLAARGEPNFQDELQLSPWREESEEVALTLRFEPPQTLVWGIPGQERKARLRIAPSEYVLNIGATFRPEESPRVGGGYEASLRAALSFLEVEGDPAEFVFAPRSDAYARLRQLGRRSLADPEGTLAALESFGRDEVGTGPGLEALLLRAVLVARLRPREGVDEIEGILTSIYRVSEGERTEFSSVERPYKRVFDNNLWLASDAYALGGARAHLAFFRIDPEVWIEQSGGREWLFPPLAPERLARIQGDLISLIALHGAGQEVDGVHFGIAWILMGGLERGLEILRPMADAGYPVAAIWAGYAAFHTHDFVRARRYWGPLGAQVEAAGWKPLREECELRARGSK